MADLNDSKQERGRLVAQMRRLNDQALASGQDLTGSDADAYRRMEAELNKLNAAIKRVDRLNEHQREAGGIAVGGSVDDDAAVQRLIASDYKQLHKLGLRGRHIASVEAAKQRCGETYSGAFWAVQRAGRNQAPPSVYGALQIGTASEGGYLVPTEYDQQLVVKKKLYNEIRAVATVTTTAADVDIPVETDEGTAAWTAEEAAYTESDAVFSQVVLILQR